ncbi:hypothetical protein [Virgibacillus sp. DJP39]|uniref:hypothetical protein n=1 Tax=Virgibacillus sp. DJP39 TaxID=3409790 RepID=UPI003BB56827
MENLKFIKPKNKQLTEVNWKISDRTRAIVKYYAEYSKFTEDEVVDEFLINILCDENFNEWIKNKRYNKRIISDVYGTEETDNG